jgi:para-aminobenzoate synthetase/4-amino-4-deoxychorismate lyase
MAAGAVRCRLDNVPAGTALEAVGFQGSIEAASLSDVLPALSEVEAATRHGFRAIGYVGYEASPAFDSALTVNDSDRRLPAVWPPSAAAALPLVWFGVFDDLVATPIVADAPGTHEGAAAWEWETDEQRFAAAVSAIHEQIASGMTYQVNLTTRLRRRFAGPHVDAGFDAYRQLVTAQGGTYNAYLETPEWALACGSPELFFELRDGRLTSKPMKGTARRGAPDEDDLISATLLNSAKERAENVMIVDLMRNDIGRVAATGTVTVQDLFALERYRTVWQMTSTVTCEVPRATSLTALLEALFPAGSVTGAPKPSTMSIISALEPSPRGPYCGAIGYVSGEATRFAVGIRTAILDARSSVIEFGVGSGITWYANAGDEWAELAAKATVLGAGRYASVD